MSSPRKRKFKRMMMNKSNTLLPEIPIDKALSVLVSAEVNLNDDVGIDQDKELSNGFKELTTNEPNKVLPFKKPLKKKKTDE